MARFAQNVKRRSGHVRPTRGVVCAEPDIGDIGALDNAQSLLG
jgi:hypothetical protein